MSLASQSYASSAIAPSPDAYQVSPASSPLPSPSTPSLSKWKSVFKRSVGSGKGNGNESRTNFLAVDGKDGAGAGVYVDEMGAIVPSPTRVVPVRSNTEPGRTFRVVEDGPESDIPPGASYYTQSGHQIVTDNSNSPSHETGRPYSSIASDTDRSSRSSGSRHGHSSNTSPTHYQNGASSASLYTNASSTTPHRNGLGSAFKSRIFSAPSDAGTSFLSMSSPRTGKKEKRTPSSTPSSRKKSDGSSSSSSHHLSPDSSGPRTPHQSKGDKGKTSPEKPPSTGKQSAAARFLRRVVSAPNTKALLGKESEVPPVPTKSPKKPSPVLVIDSDPPQVDLTTSPPRSGQSGRSSPAPFTPLSTRTAGFGSGGLSATGTRGARALTASAATRNDTQSSLGIAGDPHHKQVFRRTYSSNSIKTRQVEVSPSSFQKIKLLGKGDVGKVYLVREKKTDKLFAMKGESSNQSCR